jgi:biopolymer transport protein ExbB/TolQ
MISFVGVLQFLSKAFECVGQGASYFSANMVMLLAQQAMGLIAFGLTVNIIGTLSYNFLYGRVRRLVHDMEWSYGEILNFLTANGGIKDATFEA